MPLGGLVEMGLFFALFFVMEKFLVFRFSSALKSVVQCE